jgi:hypothetical protein
MRTIMLTIQPGQAHIAPKGGASLLQPPVIVLGVIGNAVSIFIVSVVVSSSNKIICPRVQPICFLSKTGCLQRTGAVSSSWRIEKR